MSKQRKQPSGNNRRIAFLDYLRIFAFVSVLIGHKFYDHALNFIANETHHATPRLMLRILLPFCERGGAGVVVFFLISGYIITHVLQTESPGDFFIKRIFRIYPLYIVAVLMQAATTYHLSSQLPSVQVLIPQLLLIGDFFQTPYTLQGVEWTLRVEIMFYIFMGCLRYLQMLHKHKRALPFVIIGTTILLGLLPPIPGHEIWAKGYFTLYGPFLFVGAFCYLKEVKQIGLGLLVGFTAFVLMRHYHLITVYQPTSTGTHFSTLALAIFLIAWRYNTRLSITPGILLASDLTYSVYLMHNWSWDPLKNLVQKLSIDRVHPDIQTLCALLALCFILSKLVEKPGVKSGRIALNAIRAKKRKKVSG